MGVRLHGVPHLDWCCSQHRPVLLSNPLILGAAIRLPPYVGGPWGLARSMVFRPIEMLLIVVVPRGGDVALRLGMRWQRPPQWSAFGTDGQPPRFTRTWEE